MYTKTHAQISQVCVYMHTCTLGGRIFVWWCVCGERYVKRWGGLQTCAANIKSGGNPLISDGSNSTRLEHQAHVCVHKLLRANKMFARCAFRPRLLCALLRASNGQHVHTRRGQRWRLRASSSPMLLQACGNAPPHRML